MKIQTLYRDILKKAFSITFKNRILWFLGLFAAPLIGFTEYKVLARGLGSMSGDWKIVRWYPVVETGVFRFRTFQYLGNQLINNPLYSFVLITIFILFLFLIFFFIWVFVVAQGSLIDGINQVDSKRIVKPKLSKFISTGIDKFWRMFGVHLLLKIIITVFLILLSLPIIAIFVGGKSIFAGFIYWMFLIVILPVSFIVIFSSKYAINYIAIEGESFEDSIKKGYRLFKKNWLITLEMSVILMLISIFAGLILAAIGTLLSIPFVLVLIVFAKMGVIPLLKVMLVLMFLTAFVFGIFFTAILSTYQYSSWVLLFKKLHSSDGKMVGKLARWFQF